MNMTYYQVNMQADWLHGGRLINKRDGMLDVSIPWKPCSFPIPRKVIQIDGKPLPSNWSKTSRNPTVHTTFKQLVVPLSSVDHCAANQIER